MPDVFDPAVFDANVFDAGVAWIYGNAILVTEETVMFAGFDEEEFVCAL